MSPEINRILVLFLLVGSALAVSASLLLMRLYRNAVLKRMSSFGRETTPGPERKVVHRTPSSAIQIRTLDNTSSPGRPDTISRAYRRAMQRPWQTAAVYTAAGTGYALIRTIGWLGAADDGAVVRNKVVVLFGLYFWPTVIAIVLVAAYNPTRQWGLFATYFVVLLSLSGIALVLTPDIGIGQLLLLWIIVNGLPAVIMLAFLLQPIRAVGPLVLAFVITVSLRSYLLWIPSRNEEALRSISEIGSRLDANPITVFAGMIIVGLLLFALLGWGLLSLLGKLYEQKKLSDQSMMIDSLWLLFAVVESVGVFQDSPWILAGLVALVGYKLLSRLGFRWIDAARASESQTLLLLRVFALGRRSEWLFDKLRKHWQYVGGISMIAGPDLVTSTVEPHEFLEFVRGGLSRRFVSGAQDLERRMAAAGDRMPDPDGRYRIKEFFCYNDTWQMTMERLAGASDAVLMDLRSFSRVNQGCIFELGRLLDGMDLGRVVFLVDDTTDLRFLETMLQRIWQNLSADSPNQAATEPRARLFPIMAQSERELSALLHLLLGAVSAGTAILIGVSGPVEGKQFSVKKHGLLI